MNRFNNLGYGLAVGLVRAFEAKLIKTDEKARLEGCKSVDEFALELKNINYEVADFAGFSEFCSKLNEVFNETVFQLRQSCPTFAPFNLIFFENDCFNLKTVFMLKKKGTDHYSYVLKPGFLPVSLIENCVSEQNFSGLPSHFQMLAVFLNEMLLAGCSNFEIFNKFEKKMFEIKFSLCKFSKFLFERTKLEADLHNVKMVLKSLKFDFDETSLKNALIGGGNVDVDLILKAFCEGFGSLEKLFKLNLGLNFKAMVANARLADEMFFSKFSDFDFKMRSLPFSFAAIVSYLCDLQHEHENLKRILISLSF